MAFASITMLPVSNLILWGWLQAAPVSRTHLDTSLHLTCLPSSVYPGAASPATQTEGQGLERTDEWVSELGEGSATLEKEGCGSVTRSLISEDREEMGKWPGAHGGSPQAHEGTLVLEVPAQAPGKLECESGDRRPLGMGPPLALWLPTGIVDTGTHAGLLVPTPPPARSSAVAVGAL